MHPFLNYLLTVALFRQFFFKLTSLLWIADTNCTYIYIYIYIYCVLKTSIDKIKENGFELTKKRSRRYPVKTITDADYADDMAIQSNTPAQAETLQYSQERAAAGIGLHFSAHKTEYMRFNQTGDISTLGNSSLKLVDKLTYLGSSVSSTEKFNDTRLAKAWTVPDRLAVIWKSDLTDKMKRVFFFKLRSCLYCYMDALHGRWLNGWRNILTATTQECCEQFWRSPGGNTQ